MMYVMDDVTLSACGYCGEWVQFARVEGIDGASWHLEAVLPGAGSDYLATWCEKCGPKHRPCQHCGTFEHRSDWHNE